MTSKTKYLIRVYGDVWQVAKKATTIGLKPGWIHYELKDGTIGLEYNRPNQVNWREK